MNSATLTLYFSETVNGLSLSVPKLTLQAARGGGAVVQHTLGWGTTDHTQLFGVSTVFAAVLDSTGLPVASTGDYSHTIEIAISDGDMNEIKRLDGVCTTVRCAFSDRNLHSRMSLRIPRMFA